MKKFKKHIRKSFIATTREIRETKKMIKTFKRKDIENYPQAKGQIIDIVKIVFLFPIIILPGSAVVLTLIEVVGRKFNFTIFPKKQKFKESKSSLN